MSTAPGPMGTGTPAPTPAPTPVPTSPFPRKRLVLKLIAGIAVIFLSLIIAAILLISHINVVNGGAGSWWGLGTITSFAFGLIFVTMMAMVAGLLLRKRRTRRPPTTPPAPGTPTPNAPAPKKRWPTWAVFLIAFFVLSVVLRMMVVIKNATQGDSSGGNAALHIPPPTSRTCPDMIQSEVWGKNNHRDSTAKAVVFNPCSQKELLWDSYATLPSYWASGNGSWYAEFTDADPKKDGCVAYLRYEGIDRTYGPFTGNQDMALSNKPARFRIAANCQIMYYKG